jgi:hypothetical protein
VDLDLAVVADNLLAPAVLFFAAGAVATWVKSDLEIPPPIPKLLSLYLLLSIGFRGGAELAHGGFAGDTVPSLLAAMLLAFVVPVVAFYVLRRKVSVPDAGAIAATYGSVSAVTFITATAFLDKLAIPYGGHMVAAMALMESPAIVVGVLLVRLHSDRSGPRPPMRALLHDAFLNGSVFLILSSLVVGAVASESGRAKLLPFTEEIFAGMLCLFLLDMGLVAARRLKDLRAAGAFLVGFAIATPVVSAAAAIGLARLLDLPLGDALLLTVLAASASYIAVPAAMRIAVPEANPGLTLPLALGVTFPLNIAVGIPFYLFALKALGATT